MIFCQQRIQIPDILIAALERNKWAAKDLEIKLFHKKRLQKTFRFSVQNKKWISEIKHKRSLREGEKQIWPKKVPSLYLFVKLIYIIKKPFEKSPLFVASSCERCHGEHCLVVCCCTIRYTAILNLVVHFCF